MNKLVLIFDYFKEAFHINKQNKVLYKPQIALIAAQVLIILFMGISFYNWIGIENLTALQDMEPGEILSFVFSQGLKILAIGLIYAFLSVLVEAGLLNMYKKAVTQGYIEAGDFKEGISKYFLKLLLGKLLIFLCCIPAIPVVLILGLVTLTVGLTVIPLVVSIFLTMWKTSLVMNDIGVIAAIKDSFRFAKRNFMPLTVLQIIHWAFAQGASGNNGGNFNFNFPDNSGFNQGGQSFDSDLFNIPGAEKGVEFFIKVLKITVGILIPVITIASISAFVIAMIFEVFFTLALFVAYKNDFKVEELQLPVIEAVEEENQEVVEDSLDMTENELLNKKSNITDGNEESNSREVEQ